MRRILYTNDPQTKARIEQDGQALARKALTLLTPIVLFALCLIFAAILKG